MRHRSYRENIRRRQITANIWQYRWWLKGWWNPHRTWPRPCIQKYNRRLAHDGKPQSQKYKYESAKPKPRFINRVWRSRIRHISGTSAVRTPHHITPYERGIGGGEKTRSAVGAA